jgi:hypothetical protein
LIVLLLFHKLELLAILKKQGILEVLMPDDTLIYYKGTILVVTLLKSEIKYKFSKTREELFTPFFFLFT